MDLMSTVIAHIKSTAAFLPFGLDCTGFTRCAMLLQTGSLIPTPSQP